MLQSKMNEKYKLQTNFIPVTYFVLLVHLINRLHLIDFQFVATQFVENLQRKYLCSHFHETEKIHMKFLLQFIIFFYKFLLIFQWIVHLLSIYLWFHTKHIIFGYSIEFNITVFINICSTELIKQRALMCKAIQSAERNCLTFYIMPSMGKKMNTFSNVSNELRVISKCERKIGGKNDQQNE